MDRHVADAHVVAAAAEEGGQPPVDAIELERLGPRRLHTRVGDVHREHHRRGVVGDEEDAVGAERDRAHRPKVRRAYLQPVLSHHLDLPPEQRRQS